MSWRLHMKQLYASAIMAIALFFFNVFPVMAENTTTKAAVVKMISKETKGTVSGNDITRMVNAIFTQSKRHGIEPFVMLSVVKKESRYNPRAKNRSGARGLAQVIPRWHRDKIKGRNIMHIETNIEVGMQVLADCLTKNKGIVKKAMRCYSGGARNYTANVKANYKVIQQAEIAYRFENELPIEKSSSLSDTLPIVSTSLKAIPELALKEQITQVAFNELKSSNL